MSSSTWATRKEAAVYLRVDPKTIDRYAREGRLTRHSVAGLRTVRYRWTDLYALVAPGEADSAKPGNPDAA